VYNITYIMVGLFDMLNERLPKLRRDAHVLKEGGLTAWAESKWLQLEEDADRLKIEYEVKPKDLDYAAGAHPVGSVCNKIGHAHRKEPYSVDCGLKYCSCGGWGQTGCPCFHAYALWQHVFNTSGMPRSYFHDFCFSNGLKAMFSNGSNNTVDTTDMFFFVLPLPDTYKGTPEEYARCVPRLETAGSATQSSLRIRSTGEFSGKSSVSAAFLKNNTTDPCPRCGAPVKKKGLKEHQDTNKCKKRREKHEAGGGGPRRMGLTHQA
jgi:hypothetical protein